MKVAFQADANLRHAIVRGCVTVEPSIDFRTADEAELRGLPDPDVLELAAGEDRVLVTHDVRSMPGHFAEHVRAGKGSAGVFLIPDRVPVALAIDDLVLIWSASDAAEWRNRLVWLPL